MKSLILFGFKSCGKSFFGKTLAQKLDWPFIDTDDLLIDSFGESKSISEIYKILGEKNFRELERKIIQKIRIQTPSIIALGGGSILCSQNLSHLTKIGKLVYLKSDFSNILEKILKNTLPSFVDSYENLYKIFQERTAVYELIEAEQINISSMKEQEILNKLKQIAIEEEFFCGI